MEPAVSGASWSSFGPAMPVEESELMAQLLGAYPFLSEQDHDPNMGIPSMFWSDSAADLYNSSQDVNSSLYYWPQENSSSISTSCFSLPSTDYRGCYPGESNVVPEISGTSLPMDFCMVEDQIPAPSLHIVPSDYFRDHICLNEERSDDMNQLEPVVLCDQKPQPKRKSHSDEDDKAAVNEKLDIAMAVNPKKKARAPSQVQRSSKNTKSKKAQKSASIDEDESNAALNGQSSSCYSSEDDSIASQEQSRGGNAVSSCSKEAVALNLNGKTRAGRGSATDPQSLYARKRRERINERLKILQNLVPNGTKVDISTMLEEAVEYVKFLQLQIKLLSSDELWMYAPIAYNGMNIGLDLNLIPRKQ